MRITKIFKKTNHEPRPFKMATTWEEVTTKEFCDFMKITEPDEEMTKVLAAFTGIPSDEWDARPSDVVDLAFGTLRFMTESMPESLGLDKFIDNPDKVKKYIPKEIYINEKPVKVPDDITNPAYAARQDIINAMKTHKGNLVDLFTGIAACLLYEAYTKGKYSSSKAPMLIPYIEQVPAYLIIPIVYFFLNSPKLRMLLGIKDSRRHRRKEKRKQGSKG